MADSGSYVGASKSVMGLKAVAGSPEDVAGAVYLLCLPEAAMINGHTLFVDGGFAISG